MAVQPSDNSDATSRRVESILVESDAVVVRRLRDDQKRADREQTLADAEQTRCDREQTAADTDQAMADKDQAASNLDQRARDRDLEIGADRGLYNLTLQLREESATERRKGGVPARLLVVM
jgi:hypothetical protein